jgi:hypothetical protein
MVNVFAKRCRAFRAHRLVRDMNAIAMLAFCWHVHFARRGVGEPAPWPGVLRTVDAVVLSMAVLYSCSTLDKERQWSSLVAIAADQPSETRNTRPSHGAATTAVAAEHPGVGYRPRRGSLGS